MTYYQSMMPHYIKKEEARQVMKSQKTMTSVILLILGGVVEVMAYFVVPKITGLYKDMGLSLPLSTQAMMTLSPYICVGLGAMAIYFSSNNFLDEDFEKKIANYKDGEMVNPMYFLSFKVEKMMMIVIGLVVGYLILSVIMPIYSLTSNL